MGKEDALAVINALIERFDDLEDETGANFTFAKRIILRWFRNRFN